MSAKLEEAMQEQMPPQTRNKFSKDQIERLWGWVLHEDAQLYSRFNFFLVSVSILFVVITAFPSNNKNLIYIIGLAGLVFIFMWLYVSLVLIFRTINPIKKILREYLPEYNMIVQGRKGFPSTNNMMGIFFPMVILIIWIKIIFTLV